MKQGCMLICLFNSKVKSYHRSTFSDSKMPKSTMGQRKIPNNSFFVILYNDEHTFYNAMLYIFPVFLKTEKSSLKKQTKKMICSVAL